MTKFIVNQSISTCILLFLFFVLSTVGQDSSEETPQTKEQIKECVQQCNRFENQDIIQICTMKCSNPQCFQEVYSDVKSVQDLKNVYGPDQIANQREKIVRIKKYQDCINREYFNSHPEEKQKRLKQFSKEPSKNRKKEDFQTTIQQIISTNFTIIHQHPLTLIISSKSLNQDLYGYFYQKQFN